MAYSIDSNNNISLVRGDYFATEIGMTKDGAAFTPETGSLRFAVKKKYKDPDSEILINKDIPLDTRLLELESDDTKELDFGEYVYDIEYTTADGKPDTFIHDVTFTLTEEVF